MSSTFAVINSTLVPEAEAFVHVSDLSIQRGYGVFDFFKLLNGEPVFLDEHLARFYHSAEQMRLPVHQTPEQLKELLFSLIAKNNIPYSGIRLTLTGGYSNDGFNIADPNLFITQKAFKINPETTIAGTRLVTYSHQRQFPGAKTIDYLMAIWLQNHIKENKAEDVLYQHDGIVTECPRANLFIVTKQGTLITPGKNILKGIIRSKVLKIAETSFDFEEKDISLEDIYNAKEVFITSTTKNILPVFEVDGRCISDGNTGETTRILQDKLNLMIDQQAGEMLNIKNGQPNFS